MANITLEENGITDKKIVDYLVKFGRVEVCKPIKNTSNKKISKSNYVLFLNSNSDLEDRKFLEFCKKHSIMIQLDTDCEW